MASPLEAAFALRAALLRRHRAERRLLSSTTERGVFAAANEYAATIDELGSAIRGFRDYGLAPDASLDDIRRTDGEASS